MKLVGTAANRFYRRCLDWPTSAAGPCVGL